MDAWQEPPAGRLLTVPEKTIQQKCEDAMDVYLTTISNLLLPFAPEHIVSVATTIAMPNGEALTFNGAIKPVKPELVDMHGKTIQ